MKHFDGDNGYDEKLWTIDANILVETNRILY